MSILRSLPLRERPTYKITQSGGEYCSMADLLAVLMGGPDQIEIAYALIARFGSLSTMMRASDAEYQEIAGVGLALAARLKAALVLGCRLAAEVPDDRVVIRSPGDTAALLMPEMSHLERERFVVLLLNTRNQLMQKITLYQGSGNTTHIVAAEVFQEAVRRGAVSIIVAHNHPSGDPSPSPEDVNTTRKLIAAGELLDIELVDHIIIGHKRFVSLRERSLGGF